MHKHIGSQSVMHGHMIPMPGLGGWPIQLRTNNDFIILLKYPER